MIVIEDGSIVVGANSYISVASAVSYLESRGLDASGIDDAKLILAYDYVNSFENEYQGSRVSAEQTGSFPRYDLCINGFPFASDSIPQQLKDAQAYAAYYVSQDSDILQPVSNGQTITHEEVTGAVAVDYADNGISSDTFSFSTIDALLSPLKGGFSQSLLVRRI